MKIAIATALVATSIAFASPTYAGEGNGNPFPFSAGPIAAVQFIDGVAVAMSEHPVGPVAAITETPAQTLAEVAEMPGDRQTARGTVLAR